MIPFYGPYTTDLLRTLRIRPGKPILHRQTCPVCGRTLVNIYRRDGVWKCKKCWDEGENRTEEWRHNDG